jgi:hypothetical protein
MKKDTKYSKVNVPILVFNRNQYTLINKAVYLSLEQF